MKSSDMFLWLFANKISGDQVTQSLEPGFLATKSALPLSYKADVSAPTFRDSTRKGRSLADNQTL